MDSNSETSSNNEFIIINEKLYNPFLEPLIDKICDSIDIKDSPPSPFNKSMTKNEIKTDLKKFLSDILYDKNEQGNVRKGLEIILKNLSFISEKDLVEKELLVAGTKLVDEFLNKFNEICGSDGSFQEPWEKMQSVWKEKYIETLDDQESNKKITFSEKLEIETMKQKLGISETSFEAMYAICNRLYQENNFKDALSALQFLSILDVTSSAIWFSIGLCYQKQQNFPAAITNYSMAISTDITNIQAFLLTADCYLMLKDEENAKYTLEIAKNLLRSVSLPEKIRIQYERDIQNFKIN